jgi:hypothetical protein
MMENIMYCRYCKLYESDLVVDEKNICHCSKCNGIDIIALTSYSDGTFVVEDLAYQSYFGFQDLSDFKFKIKVLNGLVERSQRKKKPKNRTDYIN